MPRDRISRGVACPYYVGCLIRFLNLDMIIERGVRREAREGGGEKYGIACLELDLY